jgi:hypothetical protein
MIFSFIRTCPQRSISQTLISAAAAAMLSVVGNIMFLSPVGLSGGWQR